jgi:hypothetical protein
MAHDLYKGKEIAVVAKKWRESNGGPHHDDRKQRGGGT